MSNIGLVLGNEAITQPLRMEYRQTQINAVVSGGKISAKLEPSTLKVNSLDTAINDRYVAQAIQTAFFSG